MGFTLQTSGELRLLDSHDGETAFPEKGLQILAYLAVSEEKDVARNRIARLVWGAADPSRALTNLRQTISRIVARQDELGVRFLDFTATSVRLFRDALTCDHDALIALRDACPENVHALLGKAITFYRLPFLSETTAPSGDYSSWIREMQHRCCETYTSAIRMALPISTSAADAVLVREAALRVFRYDPENDLVKTILSGPASVGSQGGLPERLPAEPARETPPDVGQEAMTDALGMLRAMYQRRKDGETQSVEHRLVPKPAETAPLPRLAILPPGEDDGGIVSALLEDVTIGLCSCQSVRIVAPYTSQRISRQHEKAETILRHSIHYVLDTRVTLDGATPSLFAQLIYVANDEVMWADRYRLDPSNFLGSRVEIARQVVTSISRAIGRNEETRLYFEGDPAAYFNFLQGQKSLQRYTLPEIRRARKFFKSALQDKPDFGPALSGLARTNHLEWLVTARGEPELLHAAEAYAKEAIQRHGDMTSGHRELGVTKLFLGAFDESVDALMTAEQLSPQYADVLVDFGDTLIHSSRPAEGLVKLERAIELNPVTPDGYLWAAAGANYYLEDYAQALRYIERMADPTPTLRLAAACRAMQGEIKQAKALARKLRQHYPDFEVDQWIAVLPIKEDWQREHYREGLKRAGL